MKSLNFRRRNLLKSGLSVAALSGLPLGGLQRVMAASEEQLIIDAAKKAGGADLNGMIWSLYYRNMKRLSEEFKKASGTGVGKIQDISIFQIPQRSMAEALSQSGEFDFFHIDSNMIPSLASAGLIEPLDKYMKAAGVNPANNMVGNFGNFMRFGGNTYGVPTDGNVHIEFVRKDLLEDPEERKKFADKYGREMAFPKTWEEEHDLRKFFTRPDKDMYGSGDLRNRANGVTWWYMYFYSAGGFTFDDDMMPSINTDAGKYAVEHYLKTKETSHPEASGWGTPQMIPRIVNGHVFSAQYWDGTIAQAEGPKSTTQGKWAYGIPPGSKHSGKLVHRSISSPLAAILVNRHSKRKEQAAYMALYWGTLKNSAEIVSHRSWTFHDPWHKNHLGHKDVATAYTPAGIDAIGRTMQITTPPIYLTGYLEFQDALAKNLSEAYVGQIKADEVLPKTEAAWTRLVAVIGKNRLKKELQSYKAAMPSVDVPV